MKVAVFGSGGLAREVLGYLHGDPRYEVVAAVSTEQFNNLDYGAKVKVFSRVPPGIDAYIMAVADPALKRKFVAENDDKWITYAHSNVCISPYARIGRGGMLAPFSCVIGDATVGDFVTMNVYSAVCHDAKVGNYCTFSPGAQIYGNTELGNDVFLGPKAMLLPNVKMVSGSKASAGAVVRHSILETVTVYGDPAKVRVV